MWKKASEHRRGRYEESGVNQRGRRVSQVGSSDWKERAAVSSGAEAYSNSCWRTFRCRRASGGLVSWSGDGASSAAQS